MDEQKIDFYDNSPQWQTEDAPTKDAKSRKKENLFVEDKSKNFSPLFSKTVEENGEGTVEGLKNEYDILVKLQDTEITPRPILFKNNPTEKNAHLLMSKVEGTSLEQLRNLNSLSTDDFEEVLLSVREALRTVHKRGVLMVDINPGNFLFDKSDKNKTNVIDFEFAHDVTQMSDQQMDDLGQIYQREDMGLKVLRRMNGYKLDKDAAFKVEEYLLVKMMLQLFFGNIYQSNIEIEFLSDKDRNSYIDQKQSLERLMKVRLQENSSLTNMLMLNIALPYILEQKGISCKKETVDFLQSVLNPNVDKRLSMHQLSKSSPKVDLPLAA